MTSTKTKTPATGRSKSAATRKTAAKTPAKPAQAKSAPAETEPAKPSAAKPAAAADAAKPTPAADAAKPEPAADAASPVPDAPGPAPVVVTESVPTTSAPDLKKQELLAKVVTKSGVPKRDAKPVVEAMLEIMGDALHDGRDVNLNPMGKIVIKKTKPVSNGTVLTARVRLKQKLPKT